MAFIILRAGHKDFFMRCASSRFLYALRIIKISLCVAHHRKRLPGQRSRLLIAGHAPDTPRL
jgi:hypothetical protein